MAMIAKFVKSTSATLVLVSARAFIIDTPIVRKR
jgi:hypothetical protein